MDRNKKGFVPVVYFRDGDSMTLDFYDTYAEAEEVSDVSEFNNNLAIGVEIMHLNDPLEYPDEDYVPASYIDIEEMTYEEYLAQI